MYTYCVYLYVCISLCVYISMCVFTVWRSHHAHNTHASRLENIEKAVANIFATKRATGLRLRHFPVQAALNLTGKFSGCERDGESSVRGRFHLGVPRHRENISRQHWPICISAGDIAIRSKKYYFSDIRFMIEICFCSGDCNKHDVTILGSTLIATIIREI